ncbi:MAG: dTDP-4-dehydrorhamnose 3,5-epimerase family protein [Acidobacteriota bacterium]
MKFRSLEIPGAYLLEPERSTDRHGFFARNFCRDELEERGLDPALVRCEVSVNRRSGTVQGMHYQGAPYEAVRLVRCTAGAVYVVIVDLRHDSPAYRRHVGVELCPAKRQSLYVPAGVGHGFQTLEDETEVFFQTSEMHYPECERGVRWNDPALAIEWPREITEISDRDQSFPDLVPPKAVAPERRVEA